MGGGPISTSHRRTVVECQTITAGRSIMKRKMTSWGTWRSYEIPNQHDVTRYQDAKRAYEMAQARLEVAKAHCRMYREKCVVIYEERVAPTEKKSRQSGEAVIKAEALFAPSSDVILNGMKKPVKDTRKIENGTRSPDLVRQAKFKTVGEAADAEHQAPAACHADRRVMGKDCMEVEGDEKGNEKDMLGRGRRALSLTAAAHREQHSQDARSAPPIPSEAGNAYVSAEGSGHACYVCGRKIGETDEESRWSSGHTTSEIGRSRGEGPSLVPCLKSIEKGAQDSFTGTSGARQAATLPDVQSDTNSIVSPDVPLEEARRWTPLMSSSTSSLPTDDAQARCRGELAQQVDESGVVHDSFRQSATNTGGILARLRRIADNDARECQAAKDAARRHGDAKAYTAATADAGRQDEAVAQADREMQAAEAIFLKAAAATEEEDTGWGWGEADEQEDTYTEEEGVISVEPRSLLSSSCSRPVWAIGNARVRELIAEVADNVRERCGMKEMRTLVHTAGGDAWRGRIMYKPVVLPHLEGLNAVSPSHHCWKRYVEEKRRQKRQKSTLKEGSDSCMKYV